MQPTIVSSGTPQSQPIIYSNIVPGATLTTNYNNAAATIVTVVTVGTPGATGPTGAASTIAGPVGPIGATGTTGVSGVTGSAGAAGTAATVTVGTTTTGTAAVTNSGTTSAAILNFTVPQGVTGATGATGPAGATATAATFTTAGTVKQTVYNVRDYGAVGDGITDDTIAINSAITALPLEGGIIYFPHGVYIITSKITIKKHGVSLVGEPFVSTFSDQVNQQPGMKGGSTIKASTTLFPASTTMIQYGELATSKMWTGGGVYDLLLIGTKTFITPGDGINILNVQAVRVMRCGITNCAGGVFVDSDQAGGLSNINIQLNIIYYITSIAISMGPGSQENYIRDNYIAVATGYAIKLNGIGNTVTGNHIEGTTLAGSGVADGAAIMALSPRSFISNNDILNSKTYGIYVSNSRTTVKNNHINGVNTNIIATGSGIWAAGSPTDMVITGNSINDTDAHMVYGIYDTTDTVGGLFLEANAITGAVTAKIFSTNNKVADVNFVSKVGIGIGSLVPSAQIQVSATGTAAGLRLDVPQNNGYISAYTAGSQTFGINYTTAGFIELQSFGGKVLSLNNQGNNVAIGKGTAASMLDVNGVITSPSHTITGTVTNPTDAATKGYVDSVATGLDVKASVRNATTASIANLSNASVTIDGVTLVAGNRLLVKDGASPDGVVAVSNIYNGIYVVGTVTTGTAPLTRATDANTNVQVTSGMFTFVSEGTVNTGRGYVLTTADPITLGTTALIFAQFSNAGTGITALTGDVSASGSGSVAATLASVITPGSSGSATQTSAIVYDAKGRLTSVTPTTIQIAESQVTNLTTDLAAKATDTTVVHLASAETITGAKTFSAKTGIGTTTTPSRLLTLQGLDSFNDLLQFRNNSAVDKWHIDLAGGTDLEFVETNVAGNRLRLSPGGGVGIGRSAGAGFLLDVNGASRVAGFQMATGSKNGYNFRSDASGNAKWGTTGNYYVEDYGAVGDARVALDGAITTGTASLTSATASFTAADVGKTISVGGAGAAGAILFTTVLAFVSATNVTLGANASTTVTSKLVCLGTDDINAIRLTITTANTAGGGTVILSAPMYFIGGVIDLSNRSNIRITSAGKTSSKVTIPEWALTGPAFGNAFMFNGGTTSTDIELINIYIYGLYSKYTSPVAARGGGVAPAKRWLVQGCTFEDLDYFPIFTSAATINTKIIYNRMVGLGQGADQMGGGGGLDVEIAYNIWETNLAGNVIDQTGGSYYSVHDNFIYSNNNIYFEGLTHSRIFNNKYYGTGGISVLSDSGYSPATVTNPRYIDIYNNELAGGSITCSVYSSATVPSTIGGDVKIANNTINAPASYGIAILGASADTTRWGNNYLVSNNIVRDANNGNTATVNTGTGIIAPSSINIVQGFNILVSNNICVDTRATPQQIYGIQVGQTLTPAANNEPNKVTLTGNRIDGVVTSKTNLVSSTYTSTYYEDTDGAIKAGTSVTYVVDVVGTARVQGVFFPQQATTAAAPAYVKGGMYFDTTLNKLRIGGATAWETVTST